MEVTQPCSTRQFLAWQSKTGQDSEQSLHRTARKRAFDMPPREELRRLAASENAARL
jgi:hypothetical protein